MKILENKYKLGQKVGTRNLDNPREFLPAWIIGINISYNDREVEYCCAENETGDWPFDGVKEDDIQPWEDY